MHASASLRRRASIHAALADPIRLAVVDALAISDRSPGELAASLGVGSNLLAHHLDVLERANVIERAVSAGDRRRRYLRLTGDAPDVAGAMGEPLRARRLLFVCTENAARSPLAAALWNAVSPVPAASAGTRPAARVHPRAAEAAARHGLDLSRERPRALDAVPAAPDLVISVCDRAHEADGGAWPAATRLHWSIPDPARRGTAAAFERAVAALQWRIAALAPRVLPAAPAARRSRASA